MTNFVVGKGYQTRNGEYKVVFVGSAVNGDTVFENVGNTQGSRLWTRDSQGKSSYQNGLDVVEIPVTYTEVRNMKLSRPGQSTSYVAINGGEREIEFTFDADGECIAVKLL